MASLPKNAKVGDKKTLKTPSGKRITATKTASGWAYSAPYDPNKTPASKGSDVKAKPDPTRPIGGGSPQSGPKPYINMTRGEQDRAAAAAQAAAIKKAGQDAENVRRSLIQDAYEDAGLTRSGNRKNQAPGVQPRDTEMATLRENAKKAASQKFEAYLNEKTQGGVARRDLIKGQTKSQTATPGAGNAKGNTKNFGPKAKDLFTLRQKTPPKSGTVLGKSVQSFAAEASKSKDPKFDAFKNTKLSKDEFNRFKNVYRRKHKGEVSDTYLKVMARYVKSKGTPGKGSFKTYKFKGA